MPLTRRYLCRQITVISNKQHTVRTVQRHQGGADANGTVRAHLNNLLETQGSELLKASCQLPYIWYCYAYAAASAKAYAYD